jgi:O-antigen/teichoic acid export membrane protein
VLNLLSVIDLPVDARSTRQMSADASHEPPLRPLTGGAIMSVASQLWVTLTGGITTIVLARVLGPHDWGGYSVAVSLVLVLAMLASLGVNQGIAYYVSARRWEPRAAFESSLRVALVAGVLGAAAALAARALVPSAFAGLPFSLTAVAVAALPFSLALGYASFVALATDRYEASMSMPAVQAGLLFAASIPAAVVFGRAGAIGALSGATVVTATGAIVWARLRLPKAGPTQLGQLRRAISFGIKGYSANALQLVNNQLDLFILAAVTPAATVGHYALAVSLTNLLLLLPKALSTVLSPRVARLSAGEEEEATREMVETKSLRHVSLIVVVTAVALAAALEFLVVPVFGADYRPATNLGLILLPGAATIGISSVLAATIVGRGKPTYSLYGALITTPLTTVMYATMIPRFHATGAALASTLSYLGTFLLFCGFYQCLTARKVLPLLLPTRSEFEDLRALMRAAAWTKGRG